MDFITRNPGLQHIIEEIFMNLDHKNLLKCQEVDLSWEIILKNPTFWLEKCVQKGISNEDQLEWYKLIKTLKNKDLDTGKVTSRLIIIHQWRECLICRSTSTRNDLCNGCGIKKYELYDKLEWFKLIKTLKNENSYTGNVISNLMILHECLSLSFSDSFCYICKNAFFNKYFLRIHNRKKHGICSPELPPEKVQKIINEMSK